MALLGVQGQSADTFLAQRIVQEKPQMKGASEHAG
jgi:hypothetical protein